MGILIRDARAVVGGGAQPQPVRPAPVEGTHVDVRIEGACIAAIEPSGVLIPHATEEVIEAQGRVLMPGFVDAHTHALWAGHRLDEFEMQQRGASYLDILAAGGGILSTVRAVRAASQAELTQALSSRLAVMLREGTTTVEVKSGYGLSTADELKMLRAIAAAAREFPGTVIPTAMLGHAIDTAEPNFVQTVIETTLPAVHAEFPGICIDAFCEKSAWSLTDCRRLFEHALALGHPVRMHADQFNALGAIDLALELGARSVDHLEASSSADLERLARSACYGVMLPASGFHTDGRYGAARTFLDAGGKLVLASNCNPGSSPTSSMPFVIALAVRKLGMTFTEAITAVTTSPAAMLGFQDRGRIEVGLRADLILLRHRDERLLGYELGGNPVDMVVCAGVRVHGCL